MNSTPHRKWRPFLRTTLAHLARDAIVGVCAGLLVTSTLAAGHRELGQEVERTERAFAQTMSERDLRGFVSFLSKDAVFFSGDEVLRGRDAVARAWTAFYDGPNAPFSWEPETVEVLESGDLALSTGPVRDAGGALVGTFTSIWRREAPGVWRIVFDKGTPACVDDEHGDR